MQTLLNAQLCGMLDAKGAKASATLPRIAKSRSLGRSDLRVLSRELLAFPGKPSHQVEEHVRRRWQTSKLRRGNAFPNCVGSTKGLTMEARPAETAINAFMYMTRSTIKPNLTRYHCRHLLLQPRHHFQKSILMCHAFAWACTGAMFVIRTWTVRKRRRAGATGCIYGGMTHRHWCRRTKQFAEKLSPPQRASDMRTQNAD